MCGDMENGFVKHVVKFTKLTPFSDEKFEQLLQSSGATIEELFGCLAIFSSSFHLPCFPSLHHFIDISTTHSSSHLIGYFFTETAHLYDIQELLELAKRAMVRNLSLGTHPSFSLSLSFSLNLFLCFFLPFFSLPLKNCFLIDNFSPFPLSQQRYVAANSPPPPPPFGGDSHRRRSELCRPKSQVRGSVTSFYPLDFFEFRP